MVRRRNVRAEDSDDEREGDRGDRSRRRDRASAVAKRRQTPSPPPAPKPDLEHNLANFQRIKRTKTPRPRAQLTLFLNMHRSNRVPVGGPAPFHDLP